MSTVDKKEIQKFSRIADEWWDVEGKFKPLHKFNPLRINYIKKTVMDHFNISTKSKPLKNIELLDIGCGGGLLSEPMCRFCLLYTSPSPRDRTRSRMPSSA